MSAVEGFHFRKMSNLERVYKKYGQNEKKKKKKKSEAEDRSRNIPLTTNLISLMTSKLFGLSIKAEKIKLKKYIYI